VLWPGNTYDFRITILNTFLIAALQLSNLFNVSMFYHLYLLLNPYNV